jgi:hypothetical protein
MEAVRGDTANETSAAGCTVSNAVPVTGPEVAVMVGVLAAVPVASPVAFMVAPVLELQATVLVMSAVVPSLYVPWAANCWVNPLGIEAVAGETAIETKAAGPTVKAAAPLIDPAVAVIVAVPTAVAEARPVELTLAPAVEVHTTELRICVVLSV